MVKDLGGKSEWELCTNLCSVVCNRETSQQCWETWVGCGCWLEETLGAESRIMFEEVMTGGWHQDVRGFGQQRQHEGPLQVWRFEVQDNLMLVVT